MKLFRNRDVLPASIFAVFSIIAISIFYSILKPKEILPIYQPAQVNAKLVDTSIAYKIKYHTISDFSLINQNGDTITEAFYDDKIYVADFFFTTCQSICPIMTKNMKEVQDKLINDKEILLLSHSVTPEIDSVEQLKRYAISNQINDDKWNLVTGDKKQIYNLARKSYLAVEDDPLGNSYRKLYTN
jgi:protein SCO1/2